MRDHLKVVVHRETQARLEIATFDPAMMTGKKVVGALVDEEHVLGKMPRADKAMLQVARRHAAVSRAFLAIITTQSDETPAGVFADDLKKAREVRDGKRQSAILPVLYEFPPEVQTDPAKPWMRPDTWHMVTPNVGRSISIDRLAADFEDEAAKGEGAAPVGVATPERRDRPGDARRQLGRRRILAAPGRGRDADPAVAARPLRIGRHRDRRRRP